MKGYKKLLTIAALMLVFLAPGCDENNNMMDMTPPGGNDTAACPCFTESDVKAAAQMVESQFRICRFNIAELAVAEASLEFEAVCTDCAYGTTGCFCETDNGKTDMLTEEEFLACAQNIINVVEDISHTCTPADPEG